jgi:hypothetical protein
MYFHLADITNPMYIQYLREVILSLTQNIVGICKHITVLIFYQGSSRLVTLLKFIYAYIQGVTERCGQTLGMSSTYQNKKKCPYQHMYGSI